MAPRPAAGRHGDRPRAVAVHVVNNLALPLFVLLAGAAGFA
ncbi:MULTISPECIES: hypothetical protein [Nocardiopsis]|nr:MULTISPECIES: hypothetical protein [Nocardiopsis]